MPALHLRDVRELLREDFLRMKARILLIEEHEAMRASLRHIVERDPDAQVVGEAGDVTEGGDVAIRIQPNLVIMDLDVRGMDSSRAVQRMLKAVPDARILALSLHAERPYAERALKAGASGFLLKAHAFEELGAAIRAVLEGEVFVGRGPNGRPLNESNGVKTGKHQAKDGV